MSEHVQVVSGIILSSVRTRKANEEPALPRVLMTRRLHYVARPGMWEFPGGKVKPGEDHCTALAREMLEEINVAVRVDPAMLATVTFELERTYTISLYRCHIIEEHGMRIPAVPLDSDGVGWPDFAEAIEILPLVPSCYWFYPSVRKLLEQAAREGT